MGTNCSNLTYAVDDVGGHVWRLLGPRCVQPQVAVPTMVIYAAIFVMGVFGNCVTCLVILRHRTMHTATNYYLFSLAVSDLTLLVLGLPFELHSTIGTLYPYNLPGVFCRSRAYLIELTSYASILTITAFSAERWLAICFPLKQQVFSKFSRAARVIVSIWVVAALAALPTAVIVRVNRIRIPDDLALTAAERAAVSDDNVTIRHTEVCALDLYDKEAQRAVINWSFWVFFCLPLVLISALYCHIALRVRCADRYLQSAAESSPAADADARKLTSRRSVLRMLSGVSVTSTQTNETLGMSVNENANVAMRLIAVVAAFFVCWLPFHAQRLMTVFVDFHNIDYAAQKLYELVFFISGYCFYANSAVNPIIYNILSKRFRHCFLRMLCPHCALKALPSDRTMRSHAAALRSSQRAAAVTTRRSTPCSGGSVRSNSRRRRGDTSVDAAPSVTFRRLTASPATCHKLRVSRI